MKKLFTLCSVFISLVAFSQIKVLQNEGLTEIGKDNAVGLYKKDNKYTFNYQDLNAGNLNTFRSFSFLDIDKDVENLYKLILDGFIEIPDKNIIIELPNDIIELKFERNITQPTMQFIQYFNKNRKYVGKSQFLNKKQIDKIFGKSTGKSKLYENPSYATKSAPLSTAENNSPYTNEANANSGIPNKNTMKSKTNTK